MPIVPRPRILSQTLEYVVLSYIRFFSPVLHSLAGPTFGCRFHPTCSHFALSAFRSAPLLTAFRVVFGRLLRCTPWSQGGYDPIDHHINPSKENAIS